MLRAYVWVPLVCVGLAGCVATSDEDTDLGPASSADIHGSADLSSASVAVELGAAEDSDAEPDETLEVLAAGRPASMLVDILDAVGAPGTRTALPGAAARTLRVESLVLDFNRVAISTATIPLPTLTIDSQYEVTNDEVARNIFSNVRFVESVRAQLSANHLTAVLISPATMTRVVNSLTCAFTTSSVRNAIFVNYKDSCLGNNVFVHEMGHWLGLEHTYGNDNTARGATRCIDLDGIDDTAIHLGSGVDYFCDQALPDSCPTQPGLDPFNNIMSLGCPREFTAGQRTRMSSTWTRVWRSRGFR